MEGINRRIIAAAALIFTGFGVAHAADLLNQVVLVKDASVAAAPLPLDSNQQSGVTFTVSPAQAGTYSITVTDLATPAALGTLNVSVSTATESVAQIDGAAGGAQSQNVTLAAGTYTVQPLATGGTLNGNPQAGTFSVVVTPEGGGQSFWQDQWAVSASATGLPAGESALSQEFTVTDAGTYTLTLTDQSFPAALTALELIILPHGMPTPVMGTPLHSAGTIPVSLPAGNYDLFVYAQANTSGPAAGLYSVSLVGGSTGTSVAFAASEPVGELSAATSIAVPSAGTVSLTVNDLDFPAALASASLQFFAVEGATVLQPSSGAGTHVVTATRGNVQVFAAAQPNASTGQGAYGLYATEGSQTLADVAVPVVDASHYGYAYVPPTPLATGSYQLGVNDYGLPQALGGLNAGVVQHGQLIATSEIQSTSGTATFPVDAGTVGILVFPVLAASGDQSLLGVVLSSAASGAVVFNTTNGVGALYSSTSVSIPTSGSYVVQATDLGFPAPMDILGVIITSGQAVVGRIYGGGTIPFTTQASGTYVINVFTQVGSGAHYGLYGVEASPAATATLTASPTSVTSGQTAMLTWSGSNITSCTPSGNWTASQATSGSQVTAPLTATTSFTITCSGDGGTAMATALVQVTAASQGGGGAMSGADLLTLVMASWWTLRRRRAART